MAEKDQQFDSDHLEQDDFDAFGENDDFSFDDDEQAFQIDEEDETAVAAENSEYEFSSDDAIMDESAISQSEGGFLSKITDQFKDVDSKRLIIYAVGGILGIILVLGAIIKMLFPGAPATKTQATLQQPMDLDINAGNSVPTLSGGSSALIAGASVTPSAHTAQPTAPTQMATPVLPMPVQKVEASPDLLAQNAALKKHVEILEAQMIQVNAQLASNMQLNLSNQEQIAGLIKSIDALQSQVTRVNKAMQALVTGVTQAGGMNAATNDYSYSGGAMPRAPSYYVQAIIPGRAWLKNAEGQVITVALGDPVPGYGSVATIDSQGGIVVTSTGTKFVFGVSAQ